MSKISKMGGCQEKGTQKGSKINGFPTSLPRFSVHPFSRLPEKSNPTDMVNPQ